jgi:DHA2 family multidrug resistance protein
MAHIFALLTVLFSAVSGLGLSLMSGLYITSALGGDQYLPVYTLAFFGLGNAIGVPLGKPIGERYGLRNTLVAFLILYAFLLFHCSYASSFIQFTFIRFLQGIASGTFYYLILKLVPEDLKKLYSSCSITVITLAPTFGACYGGFISYEYHWTYVFKSMFIVPLLSIPFIKQENETPTPVPFDLLGYISFAISVFCLGFVSITVQELDWYRSKWIVSAFSIGMISLIFFLIWNRASSNPILNFKLLKHPIFTFGIINLMFLYSIYFGMIILLAIWLAIYVHYDVAWVSVIIATMTIVGFIPLILTTRKKFVVDARIPLTISLIFLLSSAHNSSLFNSEVDFFRVAMSRVTAGIGFAFFLPSIFRLCFKIYQQDHASDVVNFFQVTRSLSAALGSAVYMIIWHRRYIFYHERLGESLTQYSQVTNQFFGNVANYGIKGTNANIALEQALERQSIALALEDVFYLMTFIIIGLLILVIISLFFEKRFFNPEKNVPIKIH